MTALRDVPYRAYRTAVLVGGVPEGLRERLPEALAVAARRHSFPGSPLRAARAVVRPDGPVEDAELARLAAVGTGVDEVRIALDGDRIALALPHGRLDGTGTLAFVHDLLDLASGYEPPARPPVDRFALGHALRRVRRDAILEFVRRRRDAPQTDAAAPPPTRDQVEHRGGRLVAFRLDTDDLAAVRRYRPSGVRGRATLNSRVCSLVVAALREVHRGGRDQRVRVPADLRHHVPGRTVPGNFICGDPVGTLLGGDWSPWELAPRLAAIAGSSGVVSLATGFPRHVVASARRGRGGHYAVNVSLAAGPRPWPDGWRPTTLAVTSMGAWPSPTFVFCWAIEGEVAVSLWDESDLFDVDRFEGALRRLIAERAAR